MSSCGPPIRTRRLLSWCVLFACCVSVHRIVSRRITLCHIVSLSLWLRCVFAVQHQLGHLKYLISQNCDGLHLLSGFPREHMSELHGNVFVEQCVQCARYIERSYYVCDDENDSDTCPTCHLNHFTGRKCGARKCHGKLRDTIINFGDDLPEVDLKRYVLLCGAYTLQSTDNLSRAEANVHKCDLMLSLGSSMAVTPACDLVRDAGACAIVSRQRLDKWDRIAAVRAYGDCDRFMCFVMCALLGKEEEAKWHTQVHTSAVRYDHMRKQS